MFVICRILDFPETRGSLMRWVIWEILSKASGKGFTGAS